MGRQTSPSAAVLDPCANQKYSEGTKSGLSKESGPFQTGLFLVLYFSDLLKLCKLLHAQNVKFEATLHKQHTWHES